MKFGYPLYVLQYAVSTYMWPRVLSMSGQVSRPIFPWQSIVAGSSTATFEIKCHMLPVVSEFDAQGWGPSLDIHIDDIALNHGNILLPQLIGQMRGALAYLIDRFANELGLLFAMDKFCLTGNSELLLRCAASRLGIYAGPAGGEPAIVNLGCDFAPGKNRAQPQVRKKRLARWQTAKGRILKIAALAGPKVKQAKLFFCGVKPGLTYGEEIAGWFPGEIEKMRRHGAAAIGLSSAGTNLQLAWSLDPDKAPVSHAAASLYRYCREWWMATNVKLKAHDGLSRRSSSRPLTLPRSTSRISPRTPAGPRRASGS